MKPRIVTPEILDGLADSDPAAQRSRRDLRRIHRAMGTCSLIVSTVLTTNLVARKPATLRILELGAGDGHLMLTVAHRLHQQWPRAKLTLLDRLDLLDRPTLAAYAQLGWEAKSLVVDALDWAENCSGEVPRTSDTTQWDLVIANLFLHHFEDVQLRILLSAIEQRARCFVAFEPRRSWLANAGSRLVRVIGANSVTRTDAVLSVAAGFRDTEISALWPGAPSRWMTDEHAAGLFSHCFLAQRTSQLPRNPHASFV